VKQYFRRTSLEGSPRHIAFCSAPSANTTTATAANRHRRAAGRLRELPCGPAEHMVSATDAPGRRARLLEELAGGVRGRPKSCPTISHLRYRGR